MIKEYLQYIKDNPNRYWFRAKHKSINLVFYKNCIGAYGVDGYLL
jgi:hypothetical protein